MSAPDLTPQVPGEQPTVNTDELAGLLTMTAEDLIAGLPALDDAELAALAVLEAQGEKREDVIAAVEAEQARRTDAPAPAAPLPTIEPEPVGDAGSYAHLHAHQVDATKLTGRVLTKDGWLLPRPSAQPQE